MANLANMSIPEIEEYAVERWLARLEQEQGHDYASLAGWLYANSDWCIERVEELVPVLIELRGRGMGDFDALDEMNRRYRTSEAEAQALERMALSHGF